MFRPKGPTAAAVVTIALGLGVLIGASSRQSNIILLTDSLIFTVVAGMLAYCLLSLPKPGRAIRIIILWTWLQDVLVIVLANLASEESFRILGQLIMMGKEGYLLLVLGFWVLKRHRGLNVSTIDYLAMLYVVLVLFYLVVPPGIIGGSVAGFEGKLVSARSLLLPFLLFYSARLTPVPPQQVERFVGFLLPMATISVAVGIILTSIPSEIWLDLGIARLYSARFGSDVAGAEYTWNGVPDNFYIVELGWRLVRRLSTTILEPIAAGLALAPICTLAYVEMKRGSGNLLRFTWLALGTVATFGKGGLVVLFAGLFYARTKRNHLTLIVCSFAVLLAFQILPSFSSYLGPTGVLFRPAYLANGIDTLISHPLGLGLGTAGFFTIVQSGAAMPDTEGISVTESFLGTVGAQTGLIGLLLFIAFLLQLIHTLHRIAQHRPLANDVSARLAEASTGSVIGMLVVSSISASGTGFVGLSVLLIMAGIAVSASEGTTLASQLAQYQAHNRSLQGVSPS